MDGELAGRRALITGAARGIGRAIAERLAAEAMALTLVDIDPVVEDTADHLGASAVVVDLTGDTAIETVAASSQAEPYWLIVCNAGVFATAPVLEVALDDWDRVQQINTRSMVAVMQATVPAMIAAGSGGRIVTMASMAAKLGTPGEAAYAASKAGVVALTRIAAMEFGPHQITANAICPGYVLTDMGADTRSATDIARWSEQSPLGRLAEVDDVASTVAFLASDGAGYLTGQTLNVSGGMCTW